MNFTALTFGRLKGPLAIIILLLLTLGPGAQGNGAETFQINGFYLGATPEELGVTVDGELTFDSELYETEADGAHLFFIHTNRKLHLYRIIKEETFEQENMKTILDNMKAKYGAPDKQQIKTSSVRPKYQVKYVTTVKNRAIWKISESQEFITEIESNRVVYELVDHDPKNIKSGKKGEEFEEEFILEKWDSDY